jgi:hypothetical protein
LGALIAADVVECRTYRTAKPWIRGLQWLRVLFEGPTPEPLQ